MVTFWILLKTYLTDIHFCGWPRDKLPKHSREIYCQTLLEILKRALLCFQLMRNVLFKWNKDNFKLNFLSRDQFESLNLDKIFLPLFKILPYWEVLFGNLIFAIISRMLCGNHLNCIYKLMWSLIWSNWRKELVHGSFIPSKKTNSC